MTDDHHDRVRLPLLAVRGGVGGILMGLANLVPGISGGTMLLAAGVYPRFINAVSEVSTFKFRKASLVTLGSVVLAALAAVVSLAGPVKDLVVDHRWIMYSLFIGLTLGGVPVLWRLIGAVDARVTVAAACGLTGMVVLAIAQSHSGSGPSHEGFVWMFAAGAAGASAMILPGVSGGYLLLVLGVYVPLLSAISQFVAAARGGQFPDVWAIGVSVILPVGLGVTAGVVVISNLLRLLLARHEKATLGVLLGLLLGAVAGLWPFQQGVPPKTGDRIQSQIVVLDNAGQPRLDASGRTVDPEDYATDFFAPTGAQVAGGIGLIAAGFAVTVLIDQFGRQHKR